MDALPSPHQHEAAGPNHRMRRSSRSWWERSNAALLKMRERGGGSTLRTAKTRGAEEGKKERNDKRSISHRDGASRRFAS